MFHYAQIDENGIPFSNSYLSEPVESEFMIPVDDNFDIQNKKWNGTDWEEYIPPVDPNLDEEKEMQLEQAMNIQYLVDLAEINMEE